MFTASAMVNIDMAAYETCGAGPVAVSQSSTNAESITYANVSGLTQEIRFEVYNAIDTGTCHNFTLEVRAGLSGLCSGDDSFEPNNSCATATPISAGITDGFSAVNQNPDYFGIVVPAGETVNFTTLHYSDFPMFLELYGPGCNFMGAAQTQPGASSLDRGFVTWTNSGTIASAIFVAVIHSTNEPNCQNYSVQVVFGCGTGDDDALEPNDTCTAAILLNLGPLDNRRVLRSPAGTRNDDYWQAQVRVDESITVAVDYTARFTDLNLELYDLAQPGCGDPSTGALLAVGEETINGQVVRFKNNSASNLDVALRVTAPGQPALCVEYDLLVGISGDLSFAGTVCQGVTNSTGTDADLFVQGTNRVALNNVTLACSDLPVQSFGYFLTSRGFGFVPGPGGSVGNLCIAGGPVSRYSRPGEIQTSGSGSQVSLVIDLNDTPDVGQVVSIVPGETRLFQYWYRDSVMGSPVSNFSSAAFTVFR
ncbi:hypothetical protein [Planctomycetes bacterium Poly30]|uniref:hypothetical protein n=1 Tax=Saltatorellus ferox TaxID=2528018 RepID=UPI0011A3FA20